MTAAASIDLLTKNDLTGALESLQDQVRSNPADAKLRIYLFQLLAILGDWKRAITQLKLSAEMDASAIPMAQAYREAIICEVFRDKVFAGEKDPLFFGEPLEWMALIAEALKLLAAGKAAEAADLRARAFEMVPDQGGTLNGDRFEWISDADMRLGPILEAVVNGKYFWMPFSAIATLKIDAPEDLRDFVWTPCNITLVNGGDIVALIPSRYHGTLTAGDDAAKMSRATSWQDAGADTFTGIGQRVIATDSAELPLLEVRSIEMDAIPDADG